MGPFEVWGSQGSSNQTILPPFPPPGTAGTSQVHQSQSVVSAEYLAYPWVSFHEFPFPYGYDLVLLSVSSVS